MLVSCTCADPKTLWGWFEPYVKDEEEFSPGLNGRMTTMGVYVRDLLLGQYYFDTLFPRIPIPIVRQITAHLERMNFPTKHAGVTGDTNHHGSDDIAQKPPSVKVALSVSFGQRAPHLLEILHLCVEQCLVTVMLFQNKPMVIVIMTQEERMEQRSRIEKLELKLKGRDCVVNWAWRIQIRHGA